MHSAIGTCHVTENRVPFAPRGIPPRPAPQLPRASTKAPTWCAKTEIWPLRRASGCRVGMGRIDIPHSTREQGPGTREPPTYGGRKSCGLPADRSAERTMVS